MELLTIGAFARASRLTPKALRLYDELGLLPPAHVDEVSGYRFYSPEQLERARLVAWLRRLGMPLARIRDVCDACDLAPDRAAASVADYWAETEAEVASRRGLASFLISYLSGSREETAVSGTQLAIRYAAQSDIGRCREKNQDAAYAGVRLLAVADGMGSHGDRASAAAIEALKPLEAGLPAGNLLNALSDAVRQAESAVRELSGAVPVPVPVPGAEPVPVPGAEPGGGAGAGTGALTGTGTTLTAMLLSGSQLALVHVGDTRAYLLRDGELFQITHDHSVVQSLIDEGRITPEEAVSHPQRALLLQAISGDSRADPDLSLHDAQAGDRYLLCSDGLTAVVPADAIGDAVRAADSPERAVRALIDLANEAGGPDNIACVVADVVVPPSGP